MNRNRDLEIKLAEIRRMAKYLDTSFRVPFTRIRFGLDGLIGLIPVGGDAATAVAGAYLILKASRAGASKGVLVRMVGNLLIDLILGAIPFVGDLFDFFWRSNHRNAKLLESDLSKRGAMPNDRSENASVSDRMSPLLPFCVLLHVEGSKFLRASGTRGMHWDWLFAVDDAGPLVTWSGDVMCDRSSIALSDLEGTSCSVVRLSDHRRKYLNFDGPLTDDRGAVKGIMRGTYQLLQRSTNRFEALVTQPSDLVSWVIGIQLQEERMENHRFVSAMGNLASAGSSWTLTVEASRPDVSEPASEAI